MFELYDTLSIVTTIVMALYCPSGYLKYTNILDLRLTELEALTFVPSPYSSAKQIFRLCYRKYRAYLVLTLYRRCDVGRMDHLDDLDRELRRLTRH